MPEAAEHKPSVRSLATTLAVVWVGFAVYVGLQQISVAFGMALRGLLFDTAPADPLMLASVALALVIAATLGCLGPALRVTAINPIVALRAE